ncbi:MAG TPA: hypothetical protein VFJ90_03305 [Candidatus Didemnitutus sp.]|nr:hypothetical protein [Candidatus Didemnitutus sp.]
MNSYASATRLPFTDWFTPEPDGNSPRALHAALTAMGCRFRTDGDELVHQNDSLEARLAFDRNRTHMVVKLAVIIPESRLLVGASALLDEMALEGLPVVAMGYGRGTATWEFRWIRTAGYSWRGHASRCIELIDRLRTAMRR